MITKEVLLDLYVAKRMSVKAIADRLGYSRRGVKYWMDKHEIKTRSLSDAVYTWHHPNGDPFAFIPPKTKEEHQLFGLGLGLYWGEGTKANKGSVRLGNTDPEMIKVFMNFLIKFFSLERSDFRFGLQIFSDITEKDALDFWAKKLKISRSQFYKTMITPSGSVGTYRKKSKYGVLTIYYNNTKVRDMLVSFLPA